MVSFQVTPERAAFETVPDILSGTVSLYYLYEISEAVDLHRLQELLGPQSSQAPIAFKHTTPQHLQFQHPPVIISGAPIQWNNRCHFQTRAKFYDYGVASLTLQAPFTGAWTDLVDLSAEVMANSRLEAEVAKLLESYVQQLKPAFSKPGAHRMVEDYAIFAVHEFGHPISGAALASRRGSDIARLLRGERAPLSDSETAEVMAGALSYQPNDLAVIDWNAAFIFDTAAGAEATAEILEFVNSQLLEFRYYDAILDAELAAIYQEVESGTGSARFFRSYRYRRTARRLSALYLDVSELAEKTENSLKFFGDLYASRLYRLAAQRLGVNEWKTLVNRKLQSAASLYRSLLDEVTSLRMQFMELAIILILVFELLMKLSGTAG
jgi:hypothetical protein